MWPASSSRPATRCASWTVWYRRSTATGQPGRSICPGHRWGVLVGHTEAVECVRGDVRDRKTVAACVGDVDAVFHLAAAVGVGQSMYELEHYMSTNCTGTAVLLEALIEEPVDRLVVASSMSLYGEGLYRDADGGVVADAERSREQLEAGHWEPTDRQGRPLEPIPTPEDKEADLASIYALSKYDQEQMALMMGRVYEIPTVALRFFNVYGPYQALSNPYTGVLAIFASRILNDQAPLIFEDGRQRRDFVHVSDVARACRLALEGDEAAGQVFNIGSGEAYTVREIAEVLTDAAGRPDLEPEITGDYRVGDIRHCFADIDRARRVLDYAPSVELETGVEQFTEWLRGQRADDRVEDAMRELQGRGLTV
ncbi:MAG: NAD-dependent epimerase/dehydratase family protein [Bradymonadaceae bacterium]